MHISFRAAFGESRFVTRSGVQSRSRGSPLPIVGGKVFRVIDCRSWDATRCFDDMAADDVHVQVVSPMPELLPLWFAPADTDALCRHAKEG